MFTSGGKKKHPKGLFQDSELIDSNAACDAAGKEEKEAGGLSLVPLRAEGKKPKT